MHDRTQPSLVFAEDVPFTGRTPQSRHASFLGAQHAQSRVGAQLARYIALLKAHPEGLTDQEAADLMGNYGTSINARRAVLMKRNQVRSAGFRKSAHGIKNVVWVLRQA